MTTDYLVEEFFGPNAIGGGSRLLVSNTMPTDVPRQRLMIAGTVFVPPDSMIGDQREMWECEVIIIPIRKHRKCNYNMIKNGRIDMALVSGYSEIQYWDEHEDIEG